MNIDSILKVVRGIVRIRGGSDNTVIGNFGDSIKVFRREFGIEIVDDADVNNIFTGWNLDPNAALSDSTWLIQQTKTNASGTTKKLAGTNGIFDQKFDDRTTLFGYNNLTSLLFDGVDECLLISTTSSIDFIQNSEFTLSAWVKFTSLSVAQTFFFKGMGGSGTNNSIRFYIPTTGRISFIVRASSTADRVRVRTQNLTGIINDGNWHHLVVTWDGTVSTVAANALIYIDGVIGTMDTQTDGLVGAIPPGDAWALSGVENESDNFWNGNLDEMSIWNKALSLAEVQEIYNSGAPTDLFGHSAETNLAAWWPFNDVANFPTTRDVKGENDAAMINMEVGDFVPDVP